MITTQFYQFRLQLHCDRFDKRTNLFLQISKQTIRADQSAGHVPKDL